MEHRTAPGILLPGAVCAFPSETAQEWAVCPAAFYRQATAKRGTLGGMASTGDTWRLGRRPALDGLRGIAVLLVIAGHTQLPGIHDAGKTGVTIFFVLSGFLITALLVDERERFGSVNLRAFYGRRARRLLPAQLACVALVAPVALALGPSMCTPSEVVAAVLYLKNFMGTHGVFAHFWSLAVEEQFYLLWAPLFVVLIARSRRGRALPVIAAAAAVVPLLRLTFEQSRPFGLSVAQSLPLSADALLIGCGLALWLHGRPTEVARRWMAPAGLLALILLASAGPLSLGAIGPTLVALLSGGVIWASVQHEPTVLTPAWLRWVGRRSYALYLWHYPPFYVMAVGFGVTSFWSFAPVVLPFTFLAAALSWRYVESPWLRRNEYARQFGVIRVRVHRQRPASRLLDADLHGVGGASDHLP